ncbi:MAG TPA: DUF4142 domain-containing protein, partial [Verrucomicrobiae bacterium]|nr:DUF4142 domain-containing protein [Verrucomicrobiae bacterium]
GEIAMRKGATLPSQPSEDQLKLAKHLETLSGPEFDKGYANLMVKTHTDDLRNFQLAAKEAQDAELMAFATVTATMVEAHLDMARELENGLYNTSVTRR